MSNGEGTFIWFDLTTPDPQRAMAFYRDLLGWSYTEA
ncbi:MAG: VOC family protein, partial [Thermomicrobiales bacterium]|nr:VOC family protein [Thermomicrobiales bacterium]